MSYDMMHENCVCGKRYVVDIEGKQFEACFKGYPDGDQYSPVYEIKDGLGTVKVIKECEAR